MNDPVLVRGVEAVENEVDLRRDFRELERRTAELDSRIKASEIALVEAEERARRLDAELKSLLGSQLEAEKKAGRWDGNAPPPVLPDEVVTETSRRYLNAFERITGAPLAIAGAE